MQVHEALRQLYSSKKIQHPDIQQPLHLCGKGKLGKLAQDYLRVVGVKPASIFNTDEMVRSEGQVAVCIATAPYTPIESLLAQSFDSVVPFYDLTEQFSNLHPLANGWFAEKFNSTDEERIIAVLKRWDDSTSRTHYLQFLAWRRLREEWWFQGSSIPGKGVTPESYFIPEVLDVLHDHEIFVDGGAYRGEVSKKFAELTGAKLIYAIEPDLGNHPYFDGNTLVVRAALSNENGKGKFWGGFDYCSKLSSQGNTYVTTKKLDDLVAKPTFIKLHLEGGELNALRGAEEVLTRSRPIVVVSVDHNSDGIWLIEAYLMSLLDKYKFLFRNHCWCGTGSMIYAIPDERRA